MFKKMFNWIKNLFNKIRNFIHNKKSEEYRRKLGIYYIPEDFYTNREKYEKFYILYPESDYDTPGFFENFNIVLLLNKYANAIFNAIVTLVTFIGFKFICKFIKA